MSELALISAAAAEGFRASPHQRHVWRLRSSRPAARSTVRAGDRVLEPYRISWTIAIEGAVDAARLEAARSAVAARFEICRTTLSAVEGLQEPLQYVSADDRVFQCAIVEAAGGTTRLIASLPAECADAATPELLTRELAEAYELASPARPSPADAPADLPQLVDIAAVLNELVEADRDGAGLAFWRRHVGPSPAPREVRPPGTSRSYEPKSLDVPVDARALAVLDRIIERDGHANAWWVACWLAFLSRTWTESAITLSVLCDVRHHDGLHGVPGPLARMLPFRVDVPRDQSLRRLCQSALAVLASGDDWLHAFDWERVADNAIDALPVAAFQYIEYGARVPAGAATFHVEDVRAVADHTTLLLTVAHGPDGWTIRLHYDAALVGGWLAGVMANGFARMAGDLLADVDRPISDAAMLSMREEALVVDGANETAIAWPEELSLHGLFDAQAARTPDAIAVISGGDHVSYEMLHAQSASWADRLTSAGVGADDRVGLLLRPAIALVAGMIGTLRAGAAYVPIDPAYPAARQRYMLRDAGMKALLTDRATAAGLTDVSAVIFAVDAYSPDASDAAGAAASVTTSEVAPEQAAYVIYTSGSTGQPKGVVVPHGAIVNHMRWMSDQLPLGADDAVLQKTAFSFDASVWEFWAPLISGARLVLAESDAVRDPGAIVALLRQEQITVLQGVPSWLRVLGDTAGLERCTSLRRLCAGGEVLDGLLADTLLARTNAALWNLYGPTEVTIDTIVDRVGRDRGPGAAPIGLPIANTAAYVLDRRGQPVPRGTLGELYLGGAGLARGYWGRPGATADRFVPDPYGPPGSRLYRTGDLVRRGEDLTLAYAGRVDRQVKVRGRRVEPGELEDALRSCQGVRDAAARVFGDDHRQRFVAFVEASDETFQAAAAERQIARVLPAHMLPDRIVVLPRLPRLPNGKVDANALAVPADTARPAGPAPRAGIEQRLAAVWRDLLRIDDVRTDVSFFELGGNSLLLIQAHQRIKAWGRTELSIVDLFQFPTIGSLAAHLQQQGGGE